MTGILLDLEIGDPVLDETGNTIEISNGNAFDQILDQIFHCDVGSEKMSPSYGFDLKTALQESGTPNSEMLIESLVVEALDSQKEKLISKIDYVKAVRDGREMDVTIVVTSIFDEKSTLVNRIGG